MTPAQIILLLVQNAPTILTTVEEVFAWAQKAWTEISGAIATPADQITKEQLLAHLDKIKSQSADIQNMK